MNLHANAALSWSGRRRLCELVVDEGWTVAAAAAAVGVSVRCASEHLEEDAESQHREHHLHRHVADDAGLIGENTVSGDHRCACERFSSWRAELERET